MEDQFTKSSEDELFGPIEDSPEEVSADDSTPVEDLSEAPDSGWNLEDAEDPEGQDDLNPSNNVQKDYLTRYLAARGVNKEKVQITNEDGTVEEVAFDDLTDDEKLSLLDSINDSPITDDEIATLNFLRSNNMSLNDFAVWQRNEAIKEFQNNNTQIDFTVDQLSDDQLYVFDLMDRFPEMTEEEANNELAAAKKNGAVFGKKVQALRKEYQQLEADQIEADQQQALQQREEQFDQMAQSIVNAIQSVNEINGLEIDDQDKEAILSDLLDRDVNGQSAFYKLFENPEKLVELAWYNRFGKQAFEAVNNYYKGVIERTRRTSRPEPTVKTVKKSAKPSYDPYGLKDVF